MKLLNSFKYAFMGLWFCVKNETNFRIHIIAAVSVALLAHFYKVEPHEAVLLLFTVIFVIVLEMVNTAIENITDIAATGYHPLAKIAKDVSAGAVLVAAVSAIFVGLNIFGDLEKLMAVFRMFGRNPLNAAFFGLYIFISIIFIFGIRKANAPKGKEKNE